MGNLEKLQSKIIIPETLEGDSNNESVLIARRFNEELQARLSYVVGVIMQGSRFKGYSTPDSDLDLSVLYDSEGLEYNSPEYWQRKKELDEVIDEIKKEIESKINIQILTFDVNENVLMDNVKRDRFTDLSLLFSPGFGKNLKEFIRHWVELINNLSLQQKEEMTDKILDTLVEKEIERYMVRKLIQPDKIDDLKMARRELWHKRLKSFGLA
jgi:predicted nucleotidyltransferase